jgi:hypothetical protein
MKKAGPNDPANLTGIQAYFFPFSINVQTDNMSMIVPWLNI